MQKAVLCLGSNLGNRLTILNSAIQEIKKKIGKPVLKSSFYVTESWGKAGEPDYINMVLVLETDFSARMLLQKCLAIEQKAGRVRLDKYGSRTLDIDIIDYNGEVITEDDLEIPHPRMHLRKFVLLPLEEIWPDFIHPILNISVLQMLDKIDDKLFVKKIDI